MDEVKSEPEKKDDSVPLVLPPPLPELKEEEPSTLEKALEHVDITEDSVGGHITIEF